MSDLPLPPGDWPVFRPGWVWLCGAGPGDPGLLTLHGLNALRQADVIVHDALIDPAMLGWAPQAEPVFMGKRGGQPSPKQGDISRRLVELSTDGKRVLRLKGGDPFVFGRGGEEAQTLIQQGVQVRIVPGITAGIGGLAYAGIPATHRDVNQAVSFITGHDMAGQPMSVADWAPLAQGGGVLVIYMGLRHAGRISAGLIAGGRAPEEPVAVVRNASLPDQQVLETTLAGLPSDLADSGLTPPALIVVGKVVTMRQALDWRAYATGAVPRNIDPLGTG